MSNLNAPVFISYSHDSPEHAARVLALADRLRGEGIDAVIDQYQSAPPEGWQLWMQKQIRDARFVLLVCTETYVRRVMKEETPGKGLGVLWESTIIYASLYSAGVVNDKFIPVVFGHADTRHIPAPLQPTTYYDLSTDAGYERLYRRLTNQPETPARPLGARRVLPPLPRPTHAPTPAPAETLAPNLVHPYLMQVNFTGRIAEREELTAWLADDTRPVCALIAMGGMGKSALAWQWVTKDVLPRSREAAPPAGGAVMWWSFYEGESSFAKFIDEALKYVSGQPVIDADRLPSTYDRALELRQLLQTRRILFVLDGFERQLRAYAGLDAAYHPDDDDADLPHDARTCVDPTAARLLVSVVAGTTRAKVLLTTRLMVRDLEDGAGDALAGVLKRELTELPREDAVAFMRAQGVTKGTDAEIAAACAAYGYHPLSLRLLSGLIARDARMPGDIAAAPRHDVHPDLIQRRHHVLQQSYEALPKRERKLLSSIAAFRSPTTYEALVIFNTLGNETRFGDALEDLRTRGLLHREGTDSRYDLHPIVRRYAYDRLTNKKAAHARLRDYFATIPVPDKDKVKGVEDLASVIELYHHTVRAGQYEEAWRLYYQQIGRTIYYRFGAYQTQIELLRTLFPDGEGRPPRLKEKSDQAWAMNELANSYGLYGQPRLAVPLYESDIKILERAGLKEDLPVPLGNVAVQQMNLGALAMAEQHLRRRIELCRELEDKFNEAIGHRELGRLLAYCGMFDEAVRELNTSLDTYQAHERKQVVGLIWSYHALTALLMGSPEDALAAARKARKLADAASYEIDIIRAEWLLGVTLITEGREVNAAAAHLSEALKRCRRINLMEFESDILLAWARWHHARGHAQESQARAEEALVVAERCEYRLRQAEIHNFLARLALDAKDHEAAREHAEVARERAWCDGPPHCYKPALDEAMRMLEVLGVKDRG